MLRFTTKILQFADMGEKTGWTYIRIPAALAQQLTPDKKSFRVKGRLDDHSIQKIALIPMGEGDFIMALNAGIRKAIRKQKGAALQVELEVDKAVIQPPKALLDCLADGDEEFEAFVRGKIIFVANFSGLNAIQTFLQFSQK